VQHRFLGPIRLPYVEWSGHHQQDHRKSKTNPDVAELIVLRGSIRSCVHAPPGMLDDPTRWRTDNKPAPKCREEVENPTGPRWTTEHPTQPFGASDSLPRVMTRVLFPHFYFASCDVQPCSRFEISPTSTQRIVCSSSESGVSPFRAIV
jgi:hypothetical protein